MKYTPEEIKQAIAENKIGAITFDTCIFERNNQRLEDGLLPRLEQFRNRRVRVLLSDVVYHEILAHLTESARDAESRLKAALEKVERSWNIRSQDTQELQARLLGTRAPDQVARERLRAFTDLVRAETIAAQDFAVTAELIARYFANHPPFEASGAKKHEFPDAIALLTLEAWAQAQNTKVLVVSTDKGWSRFCEASNVLVPVEELAPALSWFQNEAAEHEVRLLARSIGQGDPLGIVSAIRNAVDAQTGQIEFHVEASSDLSYEDEIVDVRAKAMDEDAMRDEDAYLLVESGEGRLVVSVAVPATFEVDCSFSFAKWDGSDKEYINFGDGSATTETTLDVTMLLFFDTADDQTVLDHVEVIRQSATVEYGEVEPDWMNDGFDEP